MLRLVLTTVALSLAAIASPASAQDFQRGLEAANQGDFAKALRNWRPLAEQGDAIPQHNLGVMYDNGRGVPEDLVSAYMWQNLASAQGQELAKKNKDIAALLMTREQIAEAQRLSRECLARKYKGC